MSIPRFSLAGAALCIGLLLTASPALAIPLQKGSVAAAFFEAFPSFYQVQSYDPSGQFQGTVSSYLSDGSDFRQVRGVAADERGRILVNVPEAGILAINPVTGDSATIGSGFNGELEPNVDGRVLARTTDTISSFDAATNSFSPVFDLSTSTALGGAFVRGVDSLADGTLILATEDTIYSLAPGASDFSVLSTGGLITEPALPGYVWRAGDVAVTADGRILVATFGNICDGCAFTSALLVEIDPVTGAQTAAYNGATGGLAGEGPPGLMAIGPDGAVYVGGDGATDRDAARLYQLLPDGSSLDMERPGQQFLRGIAVLPIPEPSTALLVGLGLAVLAGRRRRTRSA